jgi:hypothetical protein
MHDSTLEVLTRCVNTVRRLGRGATLLGLEGLTEVLGELEKDLVEVQQDAERDARNKD